MPNKATKRAMKTEYDRRITEAKDVQAVKNLGDSAAGKAKAANIAVKSQAATNAFMTNYASSSDAEKAKFGKFLKNRGQSLVTSVDKSIGENRLGTYGEVKSAKQAYTSAPAASKSSSKNALKAARAALGVGLGFAKAAPAASSAPAPRSTPAASTPATSTPAASSPAPASTTTNAPRLIRAVRADKDYVMKSQPDAGDSRYNDDGAGKLLASDLRKWEKVNGRGKNETYKIKKGSDNYLEVKPEMSDYVIDPHHKTYYADLREWNRVNNKKLDRTVTTAGGYVMNYKPVRSDDRYQNPQSGTSLYRRDLASWNERNKKPSSK
jgi:hypothetical protein